MLSERGVSRSLDRRLGALATLCFPLLCCPFAFVGKPLALVGGALAVVCPALALVRDFVPNVRLAPALGRGRLAALHGGKPPGGLRQLPAHGLPLALDPRVGALATLQLPPFRSSLALVRDPLALIRLDVSHVRQPLALVCDPLALVRDPLALACQALALVSGRLALLQALRAPLERIGQLLAPPGEPLTLLDKLFPLLGDVLALVGYSLAFPSNPKHLARLARPLPSLARALANSVGWISIRTHPDLTPQNRSLTAGKRTSRWRVAHCDYRFRRRAG